MTDNPKAKEGEVTADLDVEKLAALTHSSVPPPAPPSSEGRDSAADGVVDLRALASSGTPSLAAAVARREGLTDSRVDLKAVAEEDRRLSAGAGGGDASSQGDAVRALPAEDSADGLPPAAAPPRGASPPPLRSAPPPLPGVRVRAARRTGLAVGMLIGTAGMLAVGILVWRWTAAKEEETSLIALDPVELSVNAEDAGVGPEGGAQTTPPAEGSPTRTPATGVTSDTMPGVGSDAAAAREPARDAATGGVAPPPSSGEAAPAVPSASPAAAAPSSSSGATGARPASAASAQTPVTAPAHPSGGGGTAAPAGTAPTTLAASGSSGSGGSGSPVTPSTSSRPLDAVIAQALGAPTQVPVAAPAPTSAELPPSPSRQDVSRVLGALMPQIRACAGEQVGLAPARILVKNDGSVVSVAIAGSPFGGTPQGACMEGVVRRAQFPHFQQTTFTINFPFSIQPAR